MRQIAVTGASSGIGRETSIVLSELGARVLLVGRNRANLENTLSRLSGDGHAIEAFDLSDAEAIPRWFKGVAQRMGPFHGLVHCAGLHAAMPLAAVSAKNVEELLRVNCVASLMLAKGYRQKGCFAEGGGIVFLSSVAGIAGSPGISAYAGSKAALGGITRALAMELRREKIRVNCIAAGMVHSEMTDRIRAALTPEQFAEIEAQHPLGLGSTRDVAYAAAYLLAETGRWITGTTLILDGGYTAQ
jgi:NAD(P)-dependent dehydrogenase (short-subunit alcohol dehydrogenase family)